MKKLAYLSVFASLFLTGCIAGDYGIKPADPQMNEQDEIITLSGAVSVAEVAAIDLAAVEADSVSVGTLSVSGLDAADDVKYYVTFDEVYELEGSSDLKISKSELQAMVEDAYGKRPVARTFEALVQVNAIINGTAMLYETETFEVVLTPEAPFIASAYYLIGNMNGWSETDFLNYKFNHSDKDVYEDPVFTITFTADADCYWKIIPQTNVDAGNVWNGGATGVLGVAVDGDTAADGTLVTVNPQAGKIAEAGMYMMVINMMDYTYSIKALAPEYYLVGDNFAWDVNTKTHLMYAESATVQSYTGKFDGNLKFINGNDMGTDNWSACYGSPNDGDTASSGKLQQNAGAIHSPEAGYYTFTADLDAMTYTWTKLDNQTPTEYKTIGLVGEFCGWNQASDDNQMTQITPHNWYKSMTLTDGKLKFNANKEWTISWGGETDLNIGDDNYGVTTTADGKDMYVPAGTYDVFFNDITGRFVFVSK